MLPTRIYTRPLRSAIAAAAAASSRIASAPAPALSSTIVSRVRLASSCCSGSNPGSQPISHSHTNPNSTASRAYASTMGGGSRSDDISQETIFDNNRKWAAAKKAEDPNYFISLSAGQKPEYLWIGCSDSRIPAEQITGLEPGQAFVHRNIANLVNNIDLNVMSVINYAVRHLGVKHIVVCGHYGCGGVKAAMTPKDLGLLNPWLRNIRDVYRLHEKELDAIADEEARYNRLVELNVVEQCRNVVKTAAVQQAYKKGGFPDVHGWVFDFKDGLLKDLEVDFTKMLADIQKIYNLAEDDE